jgi:ribosomal protein S18 acetylase RimI-like enzyme
MSTLINTGIKLIPAKRFNIDELTAIYNQTRVDYMIPMPMNAARLAEYVFTYDVDLEHSLVAMQGDDLRGVAMLGVRKDRAWLTRLGVIPSTRRGGVGEALTAGIMEQAENLGRSFSHARSHQEQCACAYAFL